MVIKLDTDVSFLFLIGSYFPLLISTKKHPIRVTDRLRISTQQTIPSKTGMFPVFSQRWLVPSHDIFSKTSNTSHGSSQDIYQKKYPIKDTDVSFLFLIGGWFPLVQKYPVRVTDCLRISTPKNYPIKGTHVSFIFS